MFKKKKLFNRIIVSGRKGKMAGKAEIWFYQHFLLFPQSFERFFPKSHTQKKTRVCLSKSKPVCNLRTKTVNIIEISICQYLVFLTCRKFSIGVMVVVVDIETIMI